MVKKSTGLLDIDGNAYNHNLIDEDWNIRFFYRSMAVIFVREAKPHRLLQTADGDMVLTLRQAVSFKPFKEGRVYG